MVSIQEIYAQALAEAPANRVSTPSRPSGGTTPRFTGPTPNANRSSGNDDGGFGFGDIFGAAKSVIPTALDWLDTPRAAIVSTVKETVDAAQGEGFDLGDWLDQTQDNYGFGDLIEEETNIQNQWVKRGLGLVGDVGLDPLTYLGGASAVVKLGRTGLAGRAFDIGDNVLGQKLLKGGTSAASAADLKRLGLGDEVLQKGIFFGIGRNQIQLTSSGSGTFLYDKLAAGARKAGLTKPGLRINSLLGGRNSALKATMLNGSPDEARNAFTAVRKLQNVNGRISPFRQDRETEVAALIKQIPDEQTDVLIQKGLGGNVPAIAQLEELHGPDFLAPYIAHRENLIARGNEFVGAPVFVARDNWQPTLATPEFADYIQGNGKYSNSKIAEGFEKKAKLVEGERFLGRDLLPPAQHPEGLDVRTQVRNIIKEEQELSGGKHIEQLFDERYSVSMAAHIKSYNNAVRRHTVAQELLAEGIADPLYGRIASPMAFDEALGSARADIELDRVLATATREAVDTDAAALLAVSSIAGRPVDANTLPAVLRGLDDELSGLRAIRYELNRDGLDLKGRNKLARVQREIDKLTRARSQSEAMALGLGVDYQRVLPGEVTPFTGELPAFKGGLDVNVSAPVRVDDVGAATARYLGKEDLLDVTIDDINKFRSVLAGEGFDGIVDDAGRLHVVDAQQVISETDVPPGFYQDVMDHTDQLSDRVRQSRRVVRDLEGQIGFAPDSMTGDVVAAEATAARNAELLVDATGSEAVLRNRAAKAFADADAADDVGVAAAARLDGQAAAAAAEFESTLTSEQMLSAFRRRDFQESLEFNMKDGFSKLTEGVQAPEYVVDAVNGANKLFNDTGGALELWDEANRAFKTYAILTPGFHSRNLMGGTFNNFLADVSKGRALQVAPALLTYRRALKGGDTQTAAAVVASKHGDVGGFVAEAVRFGVVGGGQTSDVDDVFGALNKVGKSRAQKVRAAAVSNRVTKPAFNIGQGVEDQLRSTLFVDRRIKGQTVDEALDAVAKYHFDYDDLSQFERQIARRVIPFYTWSRKNLPLQIEGLLTNPKAYNRFQAVKRNIELGVEEEETVPEYVTESLHIRLPFALPGGNTYLMPELPFKELTRTVDPGEIFGSTTPYLRTPLEWKFGKKSFNNVPFRLTPQEVPQSWLGVGEAMEVLGFAEKIDGKFYARDKHLYAIEANLPLLARFRRAIPSESDAAFKDRQTTTLVNLVLGLGLFTNTERAQSNELFRQELGRREDATWDKAIAKLRAGDSS